MLPHHVPEGGREDKAAPLDAAQLVAKNPRHNQRSSALATTLTM